MLKLKLSTLDGLSAEDAKHYTKGNDGAFYLQTESVDGLTVENVSGLRSALEKERKDRETAQALVADLQKAAKAFEGIDINEAKTAMEKYKQFGGMSKDQLVAEAVEANKREMNKVHSVEVTKLQEETRSLLTQLEDATVNRAISDALAHPDIQGNPALMTNVVRQFVKYEVGADGKRYIKVVGKDGQPRVGNANGDPMTVQQLVQELKQQDEYSGGFKGTGSSGGGGSGGRQDGKSGGGSTRVVNASDTVAIGQNLEQIASGEVTVRR